MQSDPKVRLWLMAFCVWFIASCAYLGVQSPGTFNERLAVGYSSVTAARDIASTLLKARKISVADATNVLQATDVARGGLDVARELAKTDLKAADGKLHAVRVSLEALQAYLSGKQGG